VFELACTSDLIPSDILVRKSGRHCAPSNRTALWGLQLPASLHERPCFPAGFGESIRPLDLSV